MTDHEFLAQISFPGDSEDIPMIVKVIAFSQYLWIFMQFLYFFRFQTSVASTAQITKNGWFSKKAKKGHLKAKFDTLYEAKNVPHKKLVDESALVGENIWRFVS